MNRETTYRSYPEGETISEPGPDQLGLVGEFVGELYETAAVGFSYGAHPAYRHRDLEIDIETWGITPELAIDLGNSWQLRNTLHYGKSDNRVDQPQSNRDRLLGYVESGQLDPLDVASADAAVIQDILNWVRLDDVEQEMFFFRSIADGELFELPAGTLRAALGIEYTKDKAEKRNGDVSRDATGTLERKKDDRDIKSVFAELSVPVFESLALSLSARYDDYSDFGDTTNPNIGFDWNPTDWLTVFGKWGESFNAPTVLDRIATSQGTYFPNTASIVPDPNGERTNPNRDDVLLLEGAGGTLQPQTAETWGLGFEVRPLEGLKANLYYYEIDFEELLGAPNPQSAEAVLLNPEKFIFEPTQAEWDAFLAQIDNGDQFADLDPNQVGIIVDRRTANTDRAELRGIDFGIRYDHSTNFGYWSYGLSGNYSTEFDLFQGANVTDQLEFNPDLFVSADIGWSGDNTRARLTFRYTDGYDANPSQAVNQRKVDDFLTTNLLVGYDFSGSGITEGLSLRFNVDNLFDEEPPELRTQQSINYSRTGYSLGRIYKFGLSKKF